MSKQKFGASVRKALWLAHNKKCVYTNEPVEYGYMDIDHIIPENILNDDKEFERIKNEYGLTTDFRSEPFKNLIPCKRSKNLQKGQLIFNPKAMHFYLNIASSSYLKFLYEFRRLESNKAKRNICKLLIDLKFADGSNIRELETSDIEDLWDKPILIGDDPNINFIELDFEKISTCREYKNAIDKGYAPRSNMDNKLSDPFKWLCKLLEIIPKMMPYTQSFISNPRVGIVDLNLLPAEIFLELTDLESDSSIKKLPSGKTMQDLLDENEISLKSTTQSSISINNGGMGQYLFEIARGDFDDDGLEDILLFSYTYSLTGTFGYGDVYILSRNDRLNFFELNYAGYNLSD